MKILDLNMASHSKTLNLDILEYNLVIDACSMTKDNAKKVFKRIQKDMPSQVLSKNCKAHASIRLAENINTKNPDMINAAKSLVYVFTLFEFSTDMYKGRKALQGILTKPSEN